MLSGAPAFDFATIVAPVQTWLQAVDRHMDRLLNAAEPPLQPLLQHQQLMGGKRIRPLLCLLSAAACQSVTERHVAAAASVEFVHLATLVHDDLIDGAALRRQQKTVHERFGLESAVLLGDYLFATAFAQVAATGSAECASLLATGSQQVCLGEIRQNAAAGQEPLTIDQYLEVVSGKTGALCRTACGMGALLGGGSPAQQHALENFGNSLGVAFQIIDDCLDIAGDAAVVGKTLGTDLDTRKWTLPMILAVNHADATIAQETLNRWNRGGDECPELRRLLLNAGVVPAAEQFAKSQLESALSELDFIPASDVRTSLEQLADFVLVRKY